MKRAATPRSGSHPWRWGTLRWWLTSLLALGVWSAYTTGCHTLVGLDDLDKRQGQSDGGTGGRGGESGTGDAVGVGGGPVLDTVGTGMGGGVVIGECGNGALERGEECDDGNLDSGDGCSGSCEVECDGGVLSPQLHCYRLFNANVNWLNALDACYALGPGYDLAAISSASERNFMDDVLDLSGHIWLGGTDVQREGVFVWSNGEPFNFTEGWGPGEPDNNGNQDCVEYNPQSGDSNDVFNDESCNAAQPYLCELTPPGRPSSPGF